MDAACWCLRGSRGPGRDPGGFIKHTGPPPHPDHICVFVQPKRIPSDAYLPALSASDDASPRPRRDSKSSSHGFTDEPKPLPSSLQLQFQRQYHQQQEILQRRQFQQNISEENVDHFLPPPQPPRRRVRSHRSALQHGSGPSQRRGYAAGPPSALGAGGITSGPKTGRELPLATSTPRHARALPRFNQYVPVPPTVPQAAVPWSVRTSMGAVTRFSKPPLPPVADRGLPRRRHKRLTRSRDGHKSRFSSKVSLPPPRLPRDDTFSDISVVSPMPSLDVSYTAYLTPEVLTPSIIPVQPYRLSKPRFEEFFFDEYGEPFVQHNPIYSPNEELPELTISTLASGSPPTPPYVHAANVFQRLDRVRRHLERSPPIPKALQDKSPLLLPLFPLSQDSLSQVDSDYETPENFSDESKFSPRREVITVGTQTPEFPNLPYLGSPDDIPKSSDESSASSSPSRSPLAARHGKHRSRAHKSSSHRKRRQRKLQQLATPLSPIAENNGLNGISTPAIISTITTAITASSRDFHPSYLVGNLDNARTYQSPYVPPFVARQSSYNIVSSPDELLPYEQDLPYGATKPYGGLPHAQDVTSTRSKRISYPVARQHGKHAVTFRPHRKRCRRKRRGLALSREFLYVRMFDVKEDARFVYLILVLIEMFLRFEQVNYTLRVFVYFYYVKGWPLVLAKTYSSPK